MADILDRESYIPIRQHDLLDLLCKDLGADAASVQNLKRFDTLLSATFHYEYYKLIHDLKDEYAPFDPDSAARPIRPDSADERALKLGALYDRLVFLMERANFKRLSLDEIKELTQGVSDWGLSMDVDFSIFERLEVFVRGDTVGTRFTRNWWRLWRREEVKVPIFERIFLVVKVKPSPRLPAEVDTNTVFLKLFKDIPKVDMEMLFPGASVRMPGFHRIKLGGSIVSSGGWILYSIFGQLWQFVTQFSYSMVMSMVLGPLAAILGYGYKQWYGYQITRTEFSLRLTTSLYYQTLGSNLSVLFHLVNEAEEQECREALLAYYCLWRFAGAEGWTAPYLDDFVEKDLERLAGVKVDFEIADALAKLERLKLVSKNGDRYVAVQPIEKALESLDCAWDNYFDYNHR